MIEAYLKPLKEILELLFKCRPYLAKRKQRQLKHALARLYFLIIELRDSSNYFLSWLKHSEKCNSNFYFSSALRIVDSLNGIVKKMLELVDREFAREFTLAQLLQIEDHNLARRLHLLIGMKRFRLRMWEGILKELSSRNVKVAAEVRKKSLGKRNYSQVDAQIFVLPADFKIPYRNNDFAKFCHSFDIKKVLTQIKLRPDTVTEEICKSEDTIKQIDAFLAKYRAFLAQHVTIEDLLGVM